MSHQSTNSNGKSKAALLFGAPGVGKGTQGCILGQISGFVHLSSGDIFRHLDADSPLGRQVHDYTSQGLLVPDELTMQVVQKSLETSIEQDHYKPERDLLLLDGLPRNVAQAEILETMVDVLRVIYLATSDEDEEVMVQRIKRRALQENRPDDADEEVVRRRFRVYRDETEPVLQYYPAELISRVEAVATPAEVLRNILDCLIPIQKKHFTQPL